MKRRGLIAGICLSVGAAGSAVAQRVPEARPLTLVVGHADSPALAERVDGSRCGFAKTALPEGTLRVAWRRTAAPVLEHAPLVMPDGDIVVFSGRGEVIDLAPDGSEKRRLTVGPGPLGEGAILADGTIVTLSSSGEAVGIELASQTARLRFRTRVGDRAMPATVAPLALEDGGVVVVNGARLQPSASSGPWGSELATLDANGRVRARATVPVPATWPLLAARAGVAAVGVDGSVYVWSGGGTDPVRVGSFGGSLDGGAALLDDGSLVAVVDAKTVVALDLEHGETKTLYTVGRAGVVFGPPSVARGTTYVLEATQGGGHVVVLDRKGGATLLPISGVVPGLDADGGAPLLAPIHTATLVDGSGRVAFAGPDGHVGVVSASGSVDLGEPVCGRGAPPLGSPPSVSGTRTSRPSAGFAGLAPTRPGAFLVACEGGALLAIVGGS
jgi:hypothetical protein